MVIATIIVLVILNIIQIGFIVYYFNYINILKKQDISFATNIKELQELIKKGDDNVSLLYNNQKSFLGILDGQRVKLDSLNNSTTEKLNKITNQYNNNLVKKSEFDAIKSKIENII